MEKQPSYSHNFKPVIAGLCETVPRSSFTCLTRLLRSRFVRRVKNTLQFQFFVLC
jgi:hypothetical protein